MTGFYPPNFFGDAGAAPALGVALPLGQVGQVDQGSVILLGAAAPTSPIAVALAATGATVSPTTLTIPAGAYSASFAITPLAPTYSISATAAGLDITGSAASTASVGGSGPVGVVPPVIASISLASSAAGGAPYWDYIVLGPIIPGSRPVAWAELFVTTPGYPKDPALPVAIMRPQAGSVFQYRNNGQVLSYVVRISDVGEPPAVSAPSNEVSTQGLPPATN